MAEILEGPKTWARTNHAPVERAQRARRRWARAVLQDLNVYPGTRALACAVLVDKLINASTGYPPRFPDNEVVELGQRVGLNAAEVFESVANLLEHGYLTMATSGRDQVERLRLAGFESGDSDSAEAEA